MARCNYVLKAGVLLQGFGNASKTCTNANLTDELAEWHLENNPGCRIYFAVIPGVADVPNEIKGRPLPPAQGGPTIIVPPEREIPPIVGDFVAAMGDQPEVKTIPPAIEVPKPPIKKKAAATKRKR